MSGQLDEFAKLRRWAVVGVSEDREKYGNIIFRDLKAAGYEVYAVNPKLSQVEGSPCYPSLTALPAKPEVVNLVVPPQATVGVIAECLKLGLQRVWFQPGSESDEAMAAAEAGGMQVVANACIMIQKQAWV